MGKLEKVIVLSVLAVIAVILVLSLTLDDPLKKDKVVMAGSPSTKTAAAAPQNSVAADDRGERKPAPQASSSALVAQANNEPPINTAVAQGKPGDGLSALPGAGAVPADNPSGKAPSTLLSANVAQAKPDSVPAAVPAASPSGSILKTSDGLQDSYLADMKFYTWQSGDSFRSVAAKYYGDAAKFTLLRRSNEGRDNVQAGEKIFVPVFDLDGPHPADALSASSTPPKSAVSKDLTTAAPSAAKAPELPGGPRVHVVKDGESLWKIAKVELGDGGRWNEIFDANRDVMSKPEAVHVGMRLRIPAK
jgi:nucleoid-associated protein YgaU